MQKSIIRIFFLAITLLQISSAANCQTLNGVLGKPIKIEFFAKPEGFGDKPCSVQITFPDGSKKYIISSNPDFTVVTEFTPKSTGSMTINWVGESSLDGKQVAAVDGAVKQVFGNLGQLLQGKQLTQAINACGGRGAINLVVKQDNLIQAEKPNESLSTSEATNIKAFTEEQSEQLGTQAAQAKAKSSSANAVISSRGLVNSEVDEGVKKFNEKKYEEAYKILLPIAENGNPKAQGLIARLYANGWGISKDSNAAIDWAKKAATNNNPEGIYVLGFIEKDLSEKFRLTKQAADMGYPLAKAALARNYYFGLVGFAKNESEGMKYAKEAASLNDPSSQAFLGDRYVSGTGGVAKDPIEAFKWYKLAAEQGFSGGQAGVGSLFLRGDGVVKDYFEALKWFKIALDNDGNPFAAAQLGYMYMNGFGVSKNLEEAYKLNFQAANKGNPQAQANLGLQYKLGNGVTKDLEQAVIWLRKSAKTGNEFAKNQLETPELKPIIGKVEADELLASTRLEVKKQTEELERLKTQVAQTKEAQPVENNFVNLNTPSNQNSVANKSSPINPMTTMANRKALVIGNDTYKTVRKLENAREDAKTIATNLTAVGYQVTLKLDLNEKEMKAAIRNFANQVQGGDEVMFFFAGHGVQLGAANYLLPTDIVGDSEAQVRDEAIQLQRVLDDMSEKKAKFTLAMIDACRDNPFKSSGRAIGGRGLAPTTAATGQMVIFSAGTGQQALDKLSTSDKNKNGLFTRVFVQEMQKPNQSVDRVVKNVRNQVAELAKSVGHEQVPAIYDQVLGDFFFKR